MSGVKNNVGRGMNVALVNGKAQLFYYSRIETSSLTISNAFNLNVSQEGPVNSLRLNSLTCGLEVSICFHLSFSDH